MRPPYLSPSSWSTWENCRRQWAYRYVHGYRPPDGTVHTVTGLVVHTMLELWESHPPAERTEVLWEALTGWSIEAHSEDITAAGADPVQVATWSGSALAAFRSPLFADAGGEPTGVEVRHEMKVGGVPVLLIVDRIDGLEDGSSLVVDFKTGAKAKVNQGYKRQMVLSAMAAEDLTGLETSRAELWFLRAGERRKVDIGPDSRVGLLEDIARTWRAITIACLEDDFPPAPSPLCCWCPFEMGCPEGARAGRAWRQKHPGRANDPRPFSIAPANDSRALP